MYKLITQSTLHLHYAVLIDARYMAQKYWIKYTSQSNNNHRFSAIHFYFTR